MARLDIRKSAKPGKIRRDYGGRPGVTDIIERHLGWSKRGLMYWAQKIGREGGSVDKVKKAAADKGTAAHDIVAASFGGVPFDPQAHTAEEVSKGHANAARILMAMAQRGWTVLAVEIPIIGESFGGTIDAVVRAPDRRMLIVDLKTGRGVYQETAIQIGAYGWLWRTHVARTLPVEQHAEMMATEGAVVHAPYDGELRVHDVSAAEMAAGEAIFRRLLEIDGMKDQIKLGGEA